MHKMLLTIVALCLPALGSAGCGDKEVKDPDDVEPKKPPEVTQEEIDAVMNEGLEFDQEAAEIVLKRGARKVGDCYKEGAPAAEGNITAVFNGPKGRIVEVELGYEFNDANERGQQCIKNAFIGEIIPPFDGEKKVEWPIKIEEPPAAEGGKKKQ
jgi:hypothetical protein